MNGNQILVAAIDFGTTYSGYAFSTLDQLKSEPLKIFAATWNPGLGQLVQSKTSSCVLFKPDKTFHSCGFQAEEHYSGLALDNDNEHLKWFFFRRFKMILYNAMSFKRNAVIEDEGGKPMEAMVVFSAMIKFMKDQMTNMCKTQYSGLLETDIKWVLTVPAIWNDTAKQFMREAAEKAGILPGNLTIALEPEAASLFCKHLPVEKFPGGYGAFQPKAKYMVLDCGGGTVDITVHEVLEDGCLRELYKANGGDWGGTRVDDAFCKLLEDIVGKDVVDVFRKSHMYDYLELLRDFEVKKKTIQPDLEDKLIFKVPISLSETFKALNSGKSIKDHIDSIPKYRADVSWFGDKLRLDPSWSKSLFTKASEEIRAHLRELMKNPKVKDIHYVIMVGGFSDCLFIQAAAKDSITDARIVVPEEASLAVLKGAVLFGYKPNTLSSRICRYTYGINCLLPFEGNNDIYEYMQKDGKGRKFCRYRFKPFVKEGEEIKLGEKGQYSDCLTPLYGNQKNMTIPVYASRTGIPRYVLDCESVGNLLLDIPDTSLGMEREYEIHMDFGYTESHVTAVDRESRREVTVKFDFLG